MKDPAAAGTANMIDVYSARLLEILLSRGNRLPRSYGFEYEFLPHRMLLPGDMEILDAFLRESGYVCEKGTYTRGERRIVFEPGGQIEYLSPPLGAHEDSRLDQVLDWIASTNAEVENATGIRYLGTDFIPGRYDAPLLLTSPRYSRMHQRFRSVDRRGPDMMKGTAAIHMHAAITSTGDLESLFHEFCIMSRSELLGMSGNRRAIWDSTDSCRCGLPPVKSGSDASGILGCIVQQALDAVELGSGRIFRTLPDRDIDSFLDHLTTMFTDVRVNVKGGTLELRTPDSRPLDEFRPAWAEFVGLCEKVT